MADVVVKLASKSAHGPTGAGRGARTLGAPIFFAVLALATAGMALASDHPPRSQMLWALAAILVCFTAYFLSQHLAAVPGQVRFAADAGVQGQARVVRFVPPRWFEVVQASAVGVCLLATAAISYVSATTGTTLGQGRFRVGAAAIVLGLAATGIFAWTATQERGLRVSAEGLSGVRYGKRFELGWEEIHSITARGSVSLSIFAGSKLVTVYGAHVGSDPRILAELLNESVHDNRARQRWDSGSDFLSSR